MALVHFTVLSNGPTILPRRPLWSILDNWIFNNFILADEPFAKKASKFVY